MIPQCLNKRFFLTLLIFTISLIGIGCNSNIDNVSTVTSTTTQTTASTVTVTETSVQTITVPPSSLPTITVTETLSPTTTSTPTTTPTATTTTGWIIVPTTITTTQPPNNVIVPDNKTYLMADMINIPVYDALAFQRDKDTIEFFPYNNNGVYISLSFYLNSNDYLYLDIQSNTPLDSSNLYIPYNFSDGQGLTVLIYKIINGNYTSLTTNFDPSWVYAYEQTKSGDTWETKIILHSADTGIYALYLINTSGKTSSVTYHVYGWN